MAVWRPSWKRTSVRPAARRSERHALRHDVMALVGSSCLFRPCHGKTKCMRWVNPRFADVSCSSCSTLRHVAFNVGARQPADVSERRTCRSRLASLMSAIQVAMVAGLPFTRLDVFTHPTIAEGLTFLPARTLESPTSRRFSRMTRDNPAQFSRCFPAGRRRSTYCAPTSP